MSPSEFATLSELLAKAPRGLLRELQIVLGALIELESRDIDRYVATVSFGPIDATRERVEGVTYEAMLAQAVAHAIDRRLATIRQARVELDRVTDRVTWDPIVFLLERLILQASMPTSQGSSLSRADTKTGEQT